MILLPVCLAVDKAKLTLLEENTLEVKDAKNFPNGLLDGAKFEIKRESEMIWYEIQDGASTEYKGKARVAGKFLLRVTLNVSGQHFESPSEQLEVQFPDTFDILVAEGVTDRMDESWNSTLNNANSNGRREEGYYITLDTSNGTWGIGGYRLGNIRLNNQDPPQVDGLGEAKPKDVPESPNPLDQPIYTIAWFHTHTPEFFRSAADFGLPEGTLLARDAGPSQGDYDFAANTVELPGFVYDYQGVEVGGIKDQVPLGHPLDAPTTILDIVPPQRREIP